MTQVICDLPRDERPRERLLMHGAQTLSETELIALLVGSGKRGKNAIELSRELLGDGINRLGQREISYLAAIPGMGVAKATRIAAAFELARRINSGEAEQPPDFDRHVLGRQLVKTYGRVTQERLGAVLLDSRHRIIRQKEIFVGTVNNALVSTADIVKFALLENALAVVVYHNHPSGNAAPSAEDEAFTKKLQFSLGTTDIELVDHLIIGAHGYFSMKEKGLL
jgi:DNA repair protein RadC